MRVDVRTGQGGAGRPRLRWLAVVAVAAIAWPACRGDARRARPSALPAPRPQPPRENSRGVIGGPRDETAFEFEPEPGKPETPLLLDGTPPVPEDIRAGLAPY